MKRDLPAYIKRHLDTTDIAASRGLLRFIADQGTTTQTAAAKALGLARGTCNLHFQKLEHLSLIEPVNTQTNRRGRATTVWAFAQTRNYLLTLIIDAPFFQANCHDFSGAVVWSTREDWSRLKRPATLVARLREVVRQARSLIADRDGTLRQAIAFAPGIIDPQTGVIQRTVNFAPLNGLDIPALLRQQAGLDCTCEPLGLAFYYGETAHWSPPKRALVVHWDLGIGAAAGEGNRLLSHRQGDLLLAEIGHARIQPGGRRCHCGQNGCLEAYCGGWAVIESLNDPTIQSLGALKQAVRDQHPAAVAALSQAAETLGAHLYWSCYVMQIERLIISGPLASGFPLVQAAFERGLSAHFTDREIAALAPCASKDAETAMQHGAFRFARHQFFQPPAAPATSPI